MQECPVTGLDAYKEGEAGRSDHFSAGWAGGHINHRKIMKSVQDIIGLPGVIFWPGRLFPLIKQAVVDDQIVHLGAHETSIGIGRCANDGFTPDIKTGIDQHGATRQILKMGDQ